MDIKTLIGKSVISEEEKAVHRLNQPDSGCMLFAITKVEKGGQVHAFYDRMKPLFDQLDYELKEQGFSLNEYAQKTIKDNMHSALEYVFANHREDNKCFCLIGSIEKWTNATVTMVEGLVSQVITMNFCEIEVEDTEVFDVNKVKTLSVVTVPLTNHGILDIAGNFINVRQILVHSAKNMGN